jgi:hypothetical protein
MKKVFLDTAETLVERLAEGQPAVRRAHEASSRCTLLTQPTSGSRQVEVMQEAMQHRRQ